MINISKTIYDMAGEVMLSTADIYQTRSEALDRFKALKEYYKKLKHPVITINDVCFIYTLAGTTTLYEVIENEND